jgi:hypothetical protein
MFGTGFKKWMRRVKRCGSNTYIRRGKRVLGMGYGCGGGCKSSPSLFYYGYFNHIKTNSKRGSSFVNIQKSYITSFAKML